MADEVKAQRTGLVEGLVTIARRSGRGDLIQGFEPETEVEEILARELARQIDLTSEGFRRMHDLDVAGRDLMGHLLQGTARLAARMVAKADPRVDIRDPDSLRVAEEIVMEEWAERGYPITGEGS